MRLNFPPASTDFAGSQKATGLSEAWENRAVANNNGKKKVFFIFQIIGLWDLQLKVFCKKDNLLQKPLA
jgi:hypothetical protein